MNKVLFPDQERISQYLKNYFLETENDICAYDKYKIIFTVASSFANKVIDKDNIEKGLHTILSNVSLMDLSHLKATEHNFTEIIEKLFALK